MARVRLDQLLVDRGLAPSRAAAQAMVLAGEVELAAGRSLKPGNLVASDVALIVRERPRWASRAGDKLEAALNAFEVEVAGADGHGRGRLDRRLHRRPAQPGRCRGSTRSTSVARS